MTGTLQENVNSLKEKMRLSNTHSYLSQRGTLAVGEHILSHGPLVLTTELCAVYKKGKEFSSERRMMAKELFEIVSNT